MEFLNISFSSLLDTTDFTEGLVKSGNVKNAAFNTTSYVQCKLQSIQLDHNV